MKWCRGAEEHEADLSKVRCIWIMGFEGESSTEKPENMVMQHETRAHAHDNHALILTH